jgi:hypothetical protein
MEAGVMRQEETDMSRKNGRLSKRNRATYRRRARAIGEQRAAALGPRPVPAIVFTAMPAPATGLGPDDRRPHDRRAA